MSKLKENALEFKWRIKNVESWLQKRDYTLYSPQFTAGTLSKTRWKLGLFQDWQLGEKYVSLFLQRDIEDGGPQLIELNYELSILGREESALKSKSFTQKFSSRTVSNELNVKQVEILLKEKKAYLPDGVLTICCKLWIIFSMLPKVQCYTLQSVIGTKRITLETAIENFNSSSSAVVNFLPQSEDISLISLDVFVSFESGKNAYEFGFNRRHVECKGVCSYSIMLFALDNKGNSRTIRESSNLIKRPSEISQVLKLRRKVPETVFSYYLNNILNLKLVLYFHPGVVLESTEKEYSNYDDFPCRTPDLESMKTFNLEGIPSKISSCISIIESEKVKNECLDLDGMTCLLLPTIKDNSTVFKEGSTALKNSSASLQEDSTAPSEDSTSLQEDSTAPSEDSTSLQEDSTAPSEDSTSLQEDSTSLQEDSTAPSENSTSLQEDSTAPSEDFAAPSEDSTAPSEDSTAPSEDSTALCEDLTQICEDSTPLKDPESIKMPDLGVASSFSNSLSSTEPGNEEEKIDSCEKSYLPVTTLKDDLTSLYHDRQFCDVTLQFDNETFHAHRNILSARSPVFKETFMTYKKKIQGEYIEVPGISPDTARRMLQFLYTDCTGELDMQSAKDLYVASYSYGISSLKAHCSIFMKKNLHSSNVCDVLVLAGEYQDKVLESAAQEYVLNNDDKIFYSEEWKIFMKRNSGIAAEVMHLKLTENK